MIFDSIDSVLNFQDLIFLKGRTLKFAELGLYQFPLLCVEFAHLALDIAMISLTLVG